MKKNNKKFNLNFYIKVYDKNNILIQKANSRVKIRIIDYIKTLTNNKGQLKHNFKKVYIKTDYGNDNWNDSNHDNMESIINALNSYTEKSLIKFINEN